MQVKIRRTDLGKAYRPGKCVCVCNALLNALYIGVFIYVYIKMHY